MNRGHPNLIYMLNIKKTLLLSLLIQERAISIYEKKKLAMLSLWKDMWTHSQNQRNLMSNSDKVV